MNNSVIHIDSARLQTIRRRRDGEWIAGRIVVERGPEHVLKCELSISGVLPGAVAERYYAFDLEHSTHPRYGSQYKIIQARSAMPMSEAGLASYMKHHIHGIGSKRSAALIEAFGVHLPDVLDSSDACEQVHQRVPTIPKRVLEELIEEWREVRDCAHLEIALHGAGCSPRLVARMHDHFGEGLAQIASEQTYRLMEVRGVSFNKADIIAQHFGCDPSDPLRCLAAIAEALRHESQSGHCWTAWGVIVQSAGQLIELSPHSLESIIEGVCTLEQMKKLFVRDAQDRVWLPHLYRAHTTLVGAVNFRKDLVFNIPAVHTAVPAVHGLTLTVEQQSAVDGVLGHSMAILTGGPGTGKTTVVRSIIDACEASMNDPCILLAAPTGKAAKHMSESCGREATTVHRLLEWQQDGPQRDLNNPVEADLVIIDETSMLDHELAAYLFRGLPTSCRVVFVGDVDQLPSVGPGQFLADCIAAGVATFRLNQVHRQAQESLIIAAAGSIKRGELPTFSTCKGEDLYFLDNLTPSLICEKILSYVHHDIPDRCQIPVHDIRVLIPQYKGDCGIHAVNTLLQESLNPPKPEKAEIRIDKDNCLRVGDRLLWMSNQPELGLVNGAELVLKDIVGVGEKRKALLRDEDGQSYELPIHQLDVRLAYAMSVHKSQGSEYPACIVVVDPSAGRLLNRRLIYTAITRAKKLCVLLGQRRSLLQAIDNNRDEKRRSGLADDVCKMQEV